MVEIIGTVTKIGKIKDYGHETNWGRNFVHIYKFFLEVESKEHGIINAMVECTAEETNFGLRIPKGESRQRPFMGDVIKFTTHRLQKNGATWASVTFNQSFEVIKENPKAREELQNFIAQKKQEREQEFQNKVEETKRLNKERKDARLAELEQQRNDERLPELVRKEITQTFDIDKIINILRDTVWFVVPEGEGGKRAIYSLSGVMLEDGYPGSGMRRPGGPLHSLPASVRKSVLSKAIKSGLILETEKGYKATEMGIRLLVKLDTCPVCHELREPHRGTSHYTIPGRFSQSHDQGVRYHCKHEIQEQYKHQQGCNSGTTYSDCKNIDVKRKRIMEAIK